MRTELKIFRAIFACGVCLFAARSNHAQLLLADNYTATPNGTGFALGAGVNAGINPPTTRLTGLAAANLRYIQTTTKADSAFSINANKLRVTSAANPGRLTFSANGSTPFNFASALGTVAATPSNKIVYNLTIKMANNSSGIFRCSFALGINEGDANSWDFGIQIFRTAASDNFYTIGKRIDTAASGLASDVNSFITNTAPGTYGSELTFLMRVTDAGAEASGFNSRVQLSMDGGLTWFYDTASDSDLPNGWRLNGAGRYVMWDIAPSAGTVTYDDFSLRLVPTVASLVSPANNAQNLGATVTLKAAVSNAAPGALSVTYFTREAPLSGPGPDFLIPVLPDTQNYAREASGSGDATKEMWFSQTEWIITNRVSQNIPFVATLGDCVNNASTLSQWRNATNAYYRLEIPSRTLLSDGIPYGVTVGNHDQDPNGDSDGSTDLYNQYFGTSHFSGKSYYGGHYQSNNDNWYALFSAGGLDFIVISFEFGRYGSTILGWAENLLDTYPNRRCIVLTHSAGDDNSDVNATTTPFSAQGSAIYNALKTHPNFFLMLGGHVFNEGGEGRRTDTYNGNKVWTLISDYQGRFNGGNGLMRLMYFSPSNNLVSVKTYSPYTGNYETDANSQFSFSYNMQPNGMGSPGTPWVAVGADVGVTTNSVSSFVWTGLAPNKTYEWYAQVTDSSGGVYKTAPRKFKTTLNAPPVASNVTITVVGDAPSLVTLPAFDANGDVLTFRTNNFPLRGLCLGFDANSGTLTYLPAHGYRGLDRINYVVNDSVSDSAVGQVNLEVLAPPDTNGNNLPDAWESAFGIVDPDGDADGDGQSNLAEYFANTNPTNADSSLKILSAGLLPNGDFQFTWVSVGGTRYRVQNGEEVPNSFTDLFRGVEVEMDSNAYGQPSTQTYTDSSATTATSNRYYRVRVAP